MTITKAKRLGDQLRDSMPPEEREFMRKLTDRIHDVTLIYFNGYSEQFSWAPEKLTTDSIEELNHVLPDITSAHRAFFSLSLFVEKSIGEELFTSRQVFAYHLAQMNVRLLQWATTFEVDCDLSDFDHEVRKAYMLAGTAAPTMPTIEHVDAFNLIRNGRVLIDWFEKTLHDEIDACRDAEKESSANESGYTDTELASLLGNAAQGSPYHRSQPSRWANGKSIPQDITLPSFTGKGRARRWNKEQTDASLRGHEKAKEDIEPSERKPNHAAVAAAIKEENISKRASDAKRAIMEQFNPRNIDR